MGTREKITWAITGLFGVSASPVIGAFCIQYATEKKWLEDTVGKVDTAMTFLTGLADSWWFALTIGALGGAAAISWLFRWLSRAVPAPAPKDGNPVALPVKAPPLNYAGAELFFDNDEHSFREVRTVNIYETDALPMPNGAFFHVHYKEPIADPHVTLRYADGRGLKSVVEKSTQRYCMVRAHNIDNPAKLVLEVQSNNEAPIEWEEVAPPLPAPSGSQAVLSPPAIAPYDAQSLRAELAQLHRMHNLGKPLPPRQISDDQLAAMKAAVKTMVQPENDGFPHSVIFMIHVLDNESGLFAKRLTKAIEESGLAVIHGPSSAPEEGEYGLVIRVSDPKTLSPYAKQLTRFLELSGLEYMVKPILDGTGPDVQLLVAQQKAAVIA
jgi:hypothetical protein